MKLKKLCMIVLILFAISCIFVLFHYARLNLKYNYTAESVADFLYTIGNPPPYEYSKQGMEYFEFRHGIIVRLDQVYDSEGMLIESVAYGTPGENGIYYTYKDGLSIYEETGISIHETDQEGELLSETTENRTEIYFLNFSGKRLLCVSSTDSYATDNSMFPPVKFKKNGVYITYLTPMDLNENYELTFGNTTLLGDYLSVEISRKGGGSWY